MSYPSSFILHPSLQSCLASKNGRWSATRWAAATKVSSCGRRNCRSRAGFRFAHPEFWLFPTLFHEQTAKRKAPAGTLLRRRVKMVCTSCITSRASKTAELAEWNKVRALCSVSSLGGSGIEKRFRQDAELKVSLAFVRVLRAREPFVFSRLPALWGMSVMGGNCRITRWTSLASVLDDATHRQRETAIRAVIN